MASQSNRYLGFFTAVVAASALLAHNHAAGDEHRSPDRQVTHYKDWAIECTRPANPQAESCIMSQRQVLKNGQTLLVMTIRKLREDAKPVAVLQLPLGVLVRPGVSISVDGHDSRSIDYRLCNKSGCIATFVLSAELRAAFEKGRRLTVTLTAANETRLAVQVSLNGFTAALRTL